MTFTAKLKRTSHVWSNWREHRRVQGEISGVVFRLVPGLDYVSGTLTAEQVASLRHHSSVTLEIVDTVPATPPAAVDEAVVEVAREQSVAQQQPVVRQHPNRFSSGNQPKRRG